MRVLLVVPMVPQADGMGAIPKLLHAQLLGLEPRCELTVLGTFGELPGQAEAAAELQASGLDAHFADRRRSDSARRRLRVRAELAASWARRPWPWRAVSLSAGVQPLLDRLSSQRRFDVIALEDNSFSVLRLPAATPLVLTEHEAVRAAPVGSRSARPAAAPRAQARPRRRRATAGTADPAASARPSSSAHCPGSSWLMKPTLVRPALDASASAWATKR